MTEIYKKIIHYCKNMTLVQIWISFFNIFHFFFYISFFSAIQSYKKLHAFDFHDFIIICSVSLVISIFFAVLFSCFATNCENTAKQVEHLFSRLAAWKDSTGSNVRGWRVFSTITIVRVFGNCSRVLKTMRNPQKIEPQEKKRFYSNQTWQ